MRGMAARVHPAQDAGQQAIARKGEQNAGIPEQFTAQQTEHRHRGPSQHQQPQPRADLGHGIGQRHFGLRQRRTQDSLRDDLNGDVQQGHRHHRQGQRPGNGTRRLRHLPARRHRDLHA